jgi:hypothetical protein
MHLEHGQEEMLFPTLILIPIKCKHDSLEQRIDLRQGNETT